MQGFFVFLCFIEILISSCYAFKIRTLQVVERSRVFGSRAEPRLR